MHSIAHTDSLGFFRVEFSVRDCYS